MNHRDLYQILQRVCKHQQTKNSKTAIAYCTHPARESEFEESGKLLACKMGKCPEIVNRNGNKK